MLDTNYVNMVLKGLNISNQFKFKIFKTLKLIDNFKNELQLDSVYLFGSCAKEQATFGSDIDLMVITKSTDEKDIRCKCINYNIEDDCSSIPVQITVRNVEHWNVPHDPTRFIESVKKSAIKMVQY